jgi:uncharacterized protein YjeT (DUF2065 family)
MEARGALLQHEGMKSLVRTALLGLTVIVIVLGCATGSAPRAPKQLFTESVADPEAQPLRVKGARVVAAVMMRDPPARQRAEDALAREITALGGIGIPMYTLSLESAANKEGESKTRAAVEAAGATGLVVMRPVDVRNKTVATNTIAPNEVYGGYWGGYYGIGWSDPWISKTPDISTDVVVTVETFVFSLPQNKLVWTGTSETTNPQNAEKLVHKLATEGVKELRSLGLLKQ